MTLSEIVKHLASVVTTANNNSDFDIALLAQQSIESLTELQYKCQGDYPAYASDEVRTLEASLKISELQRQGLEATLEKDWPKAARIKADLDKEIVRVRLMRLQPDLKKNEP